MTHHRAAFRLEELKPSLAFRFRCVMCLEDKVTLPTHRAPRCCGQHMAPVHPQVRQQPGEA